MESWLVAPLAPVLLENEVHVWRTNLNHSPAALGIYTAVLTEDERTRAARFRFEQDRRRFVVARGALRVTLSRYLQLAPERIRFAYSPYGKPGLTAVSEGCRLQFNVSHSHELALFAVTCGREVGVDLEYIKAVPDCLDLAQQFFAPVEVTALRALPTALHTRAFFTCWTRKEAYIKAIGEGLSHPLDSFAVSFLPGEAVRVSNTNGAPYTHWSLFELLPDDGYVAALAVTGAVSTLSCWRFEA